MNDLNGSTEISNDLLANVTGGAAGKGKAPQPQILHAKAPPPSYECWPVGKGYEACYTGYTFDERIR